MNVRFGLRVKYVVLFVVFALSGSAQSAEKYHEFKNRSGKTIFARIIQYDADTSKVELELKTRKKAWVELSTLSDVDRAYIKQWHQEKPTKGSLAAETRKTLSEEEVRAIAKLYIKAWEDRDYQLWLKLVGPLHKRALSESSFNSCNQKLSLKLGQVEGLNVQIDVKGIGRSSEGWLQLLPSGEIKYTPLQFSHPLIRSFECVSYLYLHSDEVAAVWRRRSYCNTLSENNIPLFGYEPDASKNDRKRCADKIRNWLIEEGAMWDATDPKIPIPEKQFKELLKEYKNKRVIYLNQD